MSERGAEATSAPSDVTAVVRAATDDDWPFIISTWVQSDRQPGKRWHDRKIELRALLDGPETIAVCAVLPDDETAILGWAVYEGPAMRYAYVRKPLRGHGYFRAMREAVSG